MKKIGIHAYSFFLKFWFENDTIYIIEKMKIIWVDAPSVKGTATRRSGTKLYWNHATV